MRSTTSLSTVVIFDSDAGLAECVAILSEVLQAGNASFLSRPGLSRLEETYLLAASYWRRSSRFRRWQTPRLPVPLTFAAWPRLSFSTRCVAERFFCFAFASYNPSGSYIATILKPRRSKDVLSNGRLRRLNSEKLLKEALPASECDDNRLLQRRKYMDDDINVLGQL